MKARTLFGALACFVGAASVWGGDGTLVGQGMGTSASSTLPPPPKSTNSTVLPAYVPSSSPSTATPATDVLTAPTSDLGSAMRAAPLPPGSVASPSCGGCSTGYCCGPVGGNGPITYELYAETGPNFLIGGGNSFRGALNATGWKVGGGGRTLFFNTAQDAAWVVNLGVGFIYNRGNHDSVVGIFATDRFASQNAGTSRTTPIASTLRGIYRTTFNYAIGRDWFLNGPGTTLHEPAWNSRVGLDIGGRYGTAHADWFTLDNQTNDYLRVQSTTSSFVLGAHWNWERPMGSWILFGGLRTEWAATSTNIAAPQDGKLQEINVLMTLGTRF